MNRVLNIFKGLPDDLLANVASIGRACKELNGAVDQYAADVSEEIHRQLELEKRSVTSELRQVATQMQNVKKFNGTRVSIFTTEAKPNPNKVLNSSSNF